MRKKAPRRSTKTASTVLGLAWYTEENWRRVKEAAQDRADFDDTYPEWESGALAAWANFSRRKFNVVRWNVDADELRAWCTQTNRPVTRQSIVEFVTQALRFGD